MKAIKITGWVLLGLTVFAGVTALLTLILTSLWNWLMTGIFNLQEINNTRKKSGNTNLSKSSTKNGQRRSLMRK